MRSRVLMCALLGLGAACDDPVLIAEDGGVDAGSVDAGTVDAGLPEDPCEGWLPDGCDAPIRCGRACLTRCTSAVDHFAARTHCESVGGCLARFDNEAAVRCAEGLFVGGLTWIGLEQSATAASPAEGWDWRCGDVRIAADTMLWSPGQPDDGDTTEDQSEDCGVYEPTPGRLGDEECGVHHFSICARPVWR